MAKGLGNVVQSHPGRGARAPPSCRQRVTGSLPVLGQQRGALVQLLRVELLEGLRNPAVHSRAALAEL